MASKFLTLFESQYQRYQQGGILVSDFVEFIKNYKSQDCYKNLAPELQKGIDELHNSGDNLRVVIVKPRYPSAQPGNAQQTGTEYYADVTADQTGGRNGIVVSVPTSLLQVATTYPNPNPIPDKYRRKDKITIKPEEVEEDEQSLSRRTDAGDGKLRQSQLTNPTKNTTLPSKSAPTTANYMKGLKK